MLVAQHAVLFAVEFTSLYVARTMVKMLYCHK